MDITPPTSGRTASISGSIASAAAAFGASNGVARGIRAGGAITGKVVKALSVSGRQGEKISAKALAVPSGGGGAVIE
jgi:hypothetical protein